MAKIPGGLSRFLLGIFSMWGGGKYDKIGWEKILRDNQRDRKHNIIFVTLILSISFVISYFIEALSVSENEDPHFLYFLPPIIFSAPKNFTKLSPIHSNKNSKNFPPKIPNNTPAPLKTHSLPITIFKHNFHGFKSNPNYR